MRLGWHLRVWAFPAAVAIALAGCESTGAGQGALYYPSSPAGLGTVRISWRSDGGNVAHGRIRAVMPDGRQFDGTYVEPTSTLDSWATASSCGGRGCWGGSQGVGWSTVYSGKLVAAMSGPSGESMRCGFVLSDPDLGAAGGGVGRCTLSTGEHVESVVLNAE